MHLVSFFMPEMKRFQLMHWHKLCRITAVVNTLKLFSDFMTTAIRAEEERSTRILFQYQKEIKKQKEIAKIQERIRYLRQSCRCRFICLGFYTQFWNFYILPIIRLYRLGETIDTS